jgi:hypothetical protein
MHTHFREHLHKLTDKTVKYILLVVLCISVVMYLSYNIVKNIIIEIADY